MRTIGMLLTFSLLCATACAQHYAGTYSAQTATGVMTFTMQQDEYGDYIGTFVDEQGVRYTVEGEAEEEGVGGLLMSDQTELAFGAALDGGQLVLYLIPFNAAAEPDYQAARQYVLARQGNALPGQAARPSQQRLPSNPTPSATPSPLGAMMNAQQPAAGLAGTYSGAINGTPTTLLLQQQGDRLSGQADAGGYRYTLSGSANGASARGTLTDPQTGGGIDCEMAFQGDQLTLTLLVADPNTGQVNRMPMYFQRGGAAAPGGSMQGQPQAGMTQGGTYGQATGGGNEERDPSLVGMWSYTESMTSGDASMVTQMFLQVNPDGSYAYGNGRAVGGGAGWSGDTGTGGGDVSRGRWRTQNRIVYIQEGGSPQWMPYARYYIEGGRMMFTFNDGSRQIWYRK